jgi:hypothetical protein
MTARILPTAEGRGVQGKPSGATNWCLRAHYGGMRENAVICGLMRRRADRDFLPSITGQNPFNQTERDLMALPVRLGGMAIKNPVENCSSYNNLRSYLLRYGSCYTINLSHYPTRQSVIRLRRRTRWRSRHEKPKQRVRQINFIISPSSTPEACSGYCEWKGCIKLALHTSNCRAWILPSQGWFQRCSVPMLWLEAKWAGYPQSDTVTRPSL